MRPDNNVVGVVLMVVLISSLERDARRRLFNASIGVRSRSAWALSVSCSGR